jgi:signal transduction histidine kinase
LKTGPQLGTVEGDWRSLSRVFVNLLANAARYTGNGGRIWVLAEREPDRAASEGIPSGGDWVIVKVRDSGAGIPQGMLPRVFDAYVRIERGAGVSNDSPGLGLALTRHLVELHGGTVSALSDGPGRGSEFVVRLPAARAIEWTAQSRAERGGSLAAS